MISGLPEIFQRLPICQLDRLIKLVGTLEQQVVSGPTEIAPARSHNFSVNSLFAVNCTGASSNRQRLKKKVIVFANLKPA